MARYDEALTVSTKDNGVIHLRMVDRINVDDVLVHLVYQEIHRIQEGVDKGIDVPREYKDFLVKERLYGR